MSAWDFEMCSFKFVSDRWILFSLPDRFRMSENELIYMTPDGYDTLFSTNCGWFTVDNFIVASETVGDKVLALIHRSTYREPPPPINEYWLGICLYNPSDDEEIMCRAIKDAVPWAEEWKKNIYRVGKCNTVRMGG